MPSESVVTFVVVEVPSDFVTVVSTETVPSVVVSFTTVVVTPPEVFVVVSFTVPSVPVSFL